MLHLYILRKTICWLAASLPVFQLSSPSQVTSGKAHVGCAHMLGRLQPLQPDITYQNVLLATETQRGTEGERKQRRKGKPTKKKKGRKEKGRKMEAKSDFPRNENDLRWHALVELEHISTSGACVSACACACAYVCVCVRAIVCVRVCLCHGKLGGQHTFLFCKRLAFG